MNARTPLNVLLLLALVLGAGAAAAGPAPFMDYRTDSWFLPQSPSVVGGPGAGLFNPAAWGLNDRVGIDSWAVFNEGDHLGNQYGTSLGRNLGLAMQTQEMKFGDESFRVFDYALGLSGGSRGGSFGLSYRWSTGDTETLARQATIAAGVIGRPSRFASYGASAVRSVQSDFGQYVFDLGLRPLGRDWLTLFADWTSNTDEKFFDEGTWGAGIELRPHRGLHLGGRFRESGPGGDLNYSLYAGVTFSDRSVAGLPHFNEDGDHLGTTLLRRASVPFRGLDIPALNFGGPAHRYYPLNLENRVLTYQKFRWFDDTRVAWLDLLRVLNHVRDEEEIDGVAINLASFRGRPSLIWEMRQKLEEIKASGKEIIVHVDRPNPVIYYLASIADRITIDPWGNLGLPGFALSRSYLRGTLEKLGVGFQEFRYFKYKSAMETYARDNMSDADREQRQRIVDVIYEQTRAGALEYRSKLDEREYDRIVNELGVLDPQEAVELGVVDAVARWDQLGKWLGEERDGKLVSPRIKELTREYRDEQWGETLRIPVVYAVGGCSMDSGIRGRATSAYLRSLVNDPNVPAVVLRADSPGGDPLPSDLVADAIRQLKAAGKPVIVSQGDVAASGGYWISMDGTQILTTPLTITGSIGVIGGWVWDDGLAESAGISSDAVYRGEHAELMTMVNFPFLGPMPRRAMNDEELARTEKMIRANYNLFVEAVAHGRDLDPAAVGEVAQGRVWMGGDAISHGLCDRFGTLDDAIELARDLAAVPEWREVRVTEYPPRQAFRIPSLLPSIPSPFSMGATREPALDPAQLAAEQAALQAWLTQSGLSLGEWRYLQSIQTSHGEAVLQTSPDLLPELWSEDYQLD